jgi:cobalamin biosynthesis protein CobT
MTNANNTSRDAKNLDEQLDHAAEELITGDSDDPPLTEEAVVDMLKMTLQDRKLRSI